MNVKFKLLPLAVAIATTLAPLSLHAEDVVNPELTQPEDPLFDRQQPIVIAPDTPIPDTGMKFTGYARYGLHYSDSMNKYVGADGQNAGNAVGRLGNESNGGEFQFTKAFISDNGAIWDVSVMLDHWSDKVGLKKFNAGVTNVFASQPNAYLWAGRDFHQRPQQNLNDYFWMFHDGQGGGVYNLDIGGGVKFDLSAIGSTDGEGRGGDGGNYAITTKIHGISLGSSTQMSILTNYGFDSDKFNDDGSKQNPDKVGAFQIGAAIDSNWSFGGTQFVIRYTDNADASTFWKTDGLATFYTSFTGNVKASDAWNTEYLLSYHALENDNDSANDRMNYSAIVRPMYNWNEVHSTWLELGTSIVDYDNGGKNTAWKATLSQNVSINAFWAGRPMIRFYATVGEADNKATKADPEQDTFALGAMFEAWW
ncbi:carbohydrate porin [Psychromonas marina]|nr:carbohydrate porin [Psychromonas marina]